MRDVLTGLALILVLLLTGALVAPLVLDVASRRDEINTWLSKASGYEIEVTGPMGFELLPTPAVKLGHVRILTPEGDRAVIGRLKAKASIPSLLRGEIRITEALAQGVDLRIVERPEGGAQPKFFPDVAADSAWSLAADRLDIAASRLSFIGLDGRELIAAEQIDGTLDGASLAGPFKGSFVFGVDGLRRSLRFSTGKAERDSMRLRVLVESEAASMRTDFDGLLRRAGGELELAGQFNGSGNLSLPFAGTEQHLVWRLAGQIAGRGRQLKLEPAELSLGSGERQVTLPVRLGLDLASDVALDVAIAARRLDLDRLLAPEGSTGPVAPESLLPRLTDAGGALALPPWLTLALDMSATSLLLGGDVIQAPRLLASYKGRQWRFARAEAELPGQTTVSIEDGAKLRLEARDVSRLQSWAFARAARPSPVKRLRVDGALALGADAARITGATIIADDMRLTGDIGIEKGSGPPLLKLRLAADQLDVAKLPDFGEGEGDVLDLDVAIEARNLRYAGVGAGSMGVQLTRRGPALAIERLDIRDLGGATLSAKGIWGPAARDLSLQLNAARLEAMFDLLDKLGFGAGLAPLRQRAERIAPAVLSLRAKGAEAGRDFDVEMDGLLAGSDIKLRASLDAAGRVRPGHLDLSVAAADPAAFLAQIGLPTTPVRSAGLVRLRLRGDPPAAGRPQPRWSATGEIGGLRIEGSGRETGHNETPFVGDLSLESSDLAPMAQVLNIAVPAVPPGQPFRLKAGVDFRNLKITLSDLDMRFGAQTVRGEIAFNLLEFGRVSGQLRTGPLDAGGMAQLIFGPAPPAPALAPAPATGLWRNAPFAPPSAMTLPGDLWIEAETLRLLDGLTLAQPKFVFRFENGIIYIEHGRGQWAGGRFDGQATLRRIGPSVSLAGRLRLADVDLAALPGASGLTGRSDGQLEFSALGDNPRGLVSAFAGTGRMEPRAAMVQGLAPGSVPRVAERLAANPVAITGELLGQQFLANERARLPLPPGSVNLALSGGVLRAGPVDLRSGTENLRGALALDLRDLSMMAEWDHALGVTPKGWSGPLPRVRVAWRGPLAAPVASVDATALANGLTAIAIQREGERIEQLEQDARERSFFNRRLRASEDERRVEEAARKAAEDRRLREIARQEAEVREQLRLRIEEILKEPPIPTEPPLNLVPQR